MFIIYQNCPVIRFLNTQEGGIQNSRRSNGCQNFSYVHRSRKDWECKYLYMITDTLDIMYSRAGDKVQFLNYASALINFILFSNGVTISEEASFRIVIKAQ